MSIQNASFTKTYQSNNTNNRQYMVKLSDKEKKEVKCDNECFKHRKTGHAARDCREEPTHINSHSTMINEKEGERSNRNTNITTHSTCLIEKIGPNSLIVAVEINGQLAKALIDQQTI